MHGEGLNELLGPAVCGIEYAQAGIKGDALALGHHQLRHRVIHSARLAEDASVTDTHLIRAYDQPLIMLAGNGARLGMGQAADQCLGRLPGQRGFINLGGSALERQAEFFQQRLAITGSGGEDQGRVHMLMISIYKSIG
ncbi:hypothetical protein D3C86_726630 [compost metagenome]